LSEKIDKGSTSEDIENKITVEDRAVENENAAESYPDEVEGKNVEEAAIKLDLENQSGDKNITKGTTEVMTLGEKVRLPSILPSFLAIKTQISKKRLKW
jgi:ribosome-binding protein aMBF1 (putative translation factor)